MWAWNIQILRISFLKNISKFCIFVVDEKSGSFYLNILFRIVWGGTNLLNLKGWVLYKLQKVLIFLVIGVT